MLMEGTLFATVVSNQRRLCAQYVGSLVVGCFLAGGTLQTHQRTMWTTHGYKPLGYFMDGPLAFLVKAMTATFRPARGV